MENLTCGNVNDGLPCSFWNEMCPKASFNHAVTMQNEDGSLVEVSPFTTFVPGADDPACSPMIALTEIKAERDMYIDKVNELKSEIDRISKHSEEREDFWGAKVSDIKETSEWQCQARGDAEIRESRLVKELEEIKYKMSKLEKVLMLHSEDCKKHGGSYNVAEKCLLGIGPNGKEVE